MNRFDGAGRRTTDAVLLAAMAAVLVFAMRVGRPDAAPRDRPERAPWNFLIVVVDTLRYDVTSMAGQRNTPFLQSVAQRGVSFSRAFSPHDSTPPSHFTILTGQREGLGLAGDRPDASLPYQLRTRGYSTFGVSANGNLSPKWMQSLAGFTQYSNLYDEWLAMTAEERERHLPAIHARLRQFGARENEWNRSQLFASGDQVLVRFRRMLATSAEPFLGFVNILEPHDPYLPSAGSLGREPATALLVDPDVRFRTLRYPLTDPGQMKDRAAREYLLSRVQAASGRAQSLSDDLTPAEIDTYRNRYAACVRDADQVVRSIFLELERRHLTERTWVVVVSDHGESFGESGFMTHSLSDQGNPEVTHHVPMVWAAPPLFARGTTVHDDVSLADVAPTIYDLAGIDWTPLKRMTAGEFGRSLVQDLAVASDTEATAAALGGDVSEADRKRMRQDAVDRLRALGYIQ